MRLVKPKKALGQHFLKDLQIAQRIADTLSDYKDLPVLEIGPGMGVLTQYLLEATAIVHDIACPFCREKYGRADGKLQEKEGPSIVRTFLADSGMTEAQVERIAYLVGHHHTLTGIDGMDYQILIEADYLVNASEKTYSPANVQNFMNTSMKTESGKKLAKALFCL